MDQSLEFLIKISITLVLSMIVFVGLMKLQARRELRARERFDEYLKNKGLNSGENK